MASNVHIFVTGLDQMINKFDRLAGREVYEVTKARLGEHIRDAAAAVELAIPRDDGDSRRPSGALAESTRFEIEDEGMVWRAEIKVGYEGPDPIVNYAAYVRYKNMHRGLPDYMQSVYDEAERMDETMSLPFDLAFGTD